MSFFKKLLRPRDSEDEDKVDKTVAIVGLDGAGKTTIVNRLLRSDYNLVRPTFGINIEIYKYRSLEFIVYDLGGHTPLRETLWEKFVKSANGLVYVLDSADKERLSLAAEEFKNALSYNSEAPVLFLINKIDLEDTVSTEEVMKNFNLGDLTRTQREYNLARISALTGELLFESWDWLTLQLSKELDLPALNVKILGGYISNLNKTAQDFDMVILGNPKTQSKHFELFKKGEIEVKRFLRQMGHYSKAESLFQAQENQLVVVREDKLLIGLMIGENDPAARAVQIAKKLLRMSKRKISNEEDIDLRNMLEDNFPLDIIKDKI
jgi:small GTP-binding protein